MAAPQDQRRHQRYALVLICRVQTFGYTESAMLSCHDISEGGVFLSTPNPLRRGVSVQLTVNVPVLDSEIMCFARVARSVTPEQAEETGTHPGMGLAFVDPSPTFTKALGTYLELVVYQHHHPEDGADSYEIVYPIRSPYDLPEELSDDLPPIQAEPVPVEVAPPVHAEPTAQQPATERPDYLREELPDAPEQRRGIAVRLASPETPGALDEAEPTFAFEALETTEEDRLPAEATYDEGLEEDEISAAPGVVIPEEPEAHNVHYFIEMHESAKRAIDRRDFRAAYDLARDLVGHQPDNRRYQTMLHLSAGFLLKEAGDSDKAMHHFQQAADFDPDCTMAFDELRKAGIYKKRPSPLRGMMRKFRRDS